MILKYRHYSYQVLHVLGTEVRHLFWPGILYLLLLAARGYARWDTGTRTSLAMQASALTLLTGAAGAWVVIACINHGRPGSSDALPLSRPLQRSAVWLGKMLALLFLVILPWTLADLTAGIGFGFSWLGWIDLAWASFLWALLGVGLIAGLCSLAVSQRQILTLVSVGVLLAGISVWFARRGTVMAIPSLSVFSALILAIAGLGAWWCSAVLRRRVAAGSAMLLGCCAWPFLPLHSLPKNSEHSPLAYSSSTLRLSFGHPPDQRDSGSREVWPGMWLHGLQENEAATVVALAPVMDHQAWPGDKYATYYPQVGKFSFDMGEDLSAMGYLECLAAQMDPEILWVSPWNSAKLGVLSKFFADEEKRAATPWRIRLYIQKMDKVADEKIKDFDGQRRSYTLTEGMKVEIGPSFHGQVGNETAASFRLMGTTWRAQLPPHLGNGGVQAMAVLVFQDFASRLARVKPIVGIPGFRDSYYSNGWVIDKDLYHPGTIGMELVPTSLQEGFMGQMDRDPQDSVGVQVWSVEEKGTVELEISAEDMQKVWVIE